MGERRSTQEHPDLTAGIAHDLGNLLSVVLVNSGELCAGIEDHALRELAEEIRTAAERGAGLTRRLIDGSALDLGRTAEPVDPNRILRDCEPLLRGAAGCGASFRLELDPRVPMVRIDPAALERAVTNVVANAGEAVGDEGTIVLTTRLLVAGTEREDLGIGWHAQIAVTDDGIGMDPQVLGRAGDPYFTTRAAEGGRGIGLTNVHRIIEAAGGVVEMTSLTGAGTEVRLLLPGVTANGDPLSLS